MTLAPFPQFNRFAIRAALDQGGITLRPWQRDALIRATDPSCPDASLIVAIMGAGKSIVLALLACAWRGPVVVSTSSIDLVEALRAVIARLSGEPVGAYYTSAKDVQRITVVCLPSLATYAAATGAQTGLLWIADEAHKCERSSVEAFLSACPPAHRIGMTATPYRADTGLTLWRSELLRYGIEDAITSGALVPFRVHFPKGKGFADVDDLVIDWVRSGTGACVISAADIADCDAFALACCEAGLRVAALHSRNRRSHATTMAALRSGELDAIVHCHMLSEGVDMPFLRRLVLRHARGSRVEFAQEIGRVLRACEGKAHADVFDPWQVTLTHDLQSPVQVEDAITAAPKAKASEPPPPMIDPLTGEPIVWADLPAKERKRIWLATDAVAFLGSAALALRASGVARQYSETGQWRREPATPAQLQALTRLRSTVSWVRGQGHVLRGIGPTGAPIVQAICRAFSAVSSSPKLRKGLASDLLTCVLTVLSGRSDAPYFGDPMQRELVTRARAFTAFATYHVDPAPLL
jgi:hypothetical protein